MLKVLNLLIGAFISKEDWADSKPIMKLNIIVKAFLVMVGMILYDPYFNPTKSTLMFTHMVGYDHSDIRRYFAFFLEWDGIHFFRSYKFGYTTLTNFVFYPMLPAIMHFFDWVLSALYLPRLLLEYLNLWKVSGILTVLIMNVALHLVNTFLIYRFARLKKYNKDQSKFVAVIFSVIGTGLYHVVLYSESLYLFITLSSLCVIEHMFNNKITMHDIPFSSFLVLCVFFGSSGWVRSLGLMNGIYIGYPLFLHFVYLLYHKKNLASVCGRIMIVIFLFVYPTFLVNLYSRWMFCSKRPEINIDGMRYLHPEFCNSLTAWSYSYIQKRNWNVEYFMWMKRDESTGYLLVVSFLMCVFWFVRFFKNNRLVDLGTLNIKLYLEHKDYTYGQIRHFPDLVLMVILCRMFYIYANAESVERFWTVSPPFLITILEYQMCTNKLYRSYCEKKERNIILQCLYNAMRCLTVGNIIFKHLITVPFYSMRVRPA